MAETHYEYNLSVPAELIDYVSTNNKSQNYWAHILTPEEQAQLEQQASKYFRLPNLTFEQFVLETKVDDLAEVHPYVPRFYKKQGLFLIWSVDLDKSISWLPDTIAPQVADGLTFKTELQMAKSSCPNYSEFFIAQVHIEDSYVFVSAVKTPNWLNRSPITALRAYYRKFWKHLVSAFDKTIIVPNINLIKDAHRTINNRGIPHEPYHREVLQAAGLRRQPLGQYANDMIRLLPEDEVWIYVR
jgi:hypothetical protein